ncbi:transporter [Virgibacillus sp. W0430]|uniref:transporter n=1 Tax=Virgibacillus sp. W0430 TaxID=3391580 RepID=UPI003F46442F
MKKQKVMQYVYESIMILLVIMTIMTIWSENKVNSTINWVVWVIFLVDFTIRLIVSKQKWDFIKRNPFLLIAIIPFDQFFQIARFVRIIYFFRIKTIAKYYITPYVKRLNYKSLGVLVVGFVLFIVLEALIVWTLEDIIHTYGEAVYAVISYLFFVGHRIFSVDHLLSIWLLTITSVFGVVLQGLALQWLFAKVDIVYNRYKAKRDASQAS